MEFLQTLHNLYFSELMLNWYWYYTCSSRGRNLIRFIQILFTDLLQSLSSLYKNKDLPVHKFPSSFIANGTSTFVGQVAPC